MTAGKEGALQEGFDTGFAQTGAPLGRELGLLRGLASALLLHLSRSQQPQEPGSSPAAAVREIVAALAAVRFADIAPPPPPPPSHPHEGEEAEETAHAHCASVTAAEGVKGEGKGEGEEGLSARSVGLTRSAVTTTIEDVRALRMKLETLLRESGLKIDLNLEIF